MGALLSSRVKCDMGAWGASQTKQNVSSRAETQDVSGLIRKFFVSLAFTVRTAKNGALAPRK